MTSLTELREEEAILRKEIDKRLEMEERFWHQRSRINWLKFGDRNTRFFHLSTVNRRRQNSILKIKGNSGEWIKDEAQIRSYMEDHFKDLFKAGELSGVDEVLESVPRVFSDEANRNLCKEVSEDEIRNVVRAGSSQGTRSRWFSR